MRRLGDHRRRAVAHGRVQRKRVEANAPEELGVEAYAGVRLEALADHPSERNARERMRGVVCDAPSADVCGSK